MRVRIIAARVRELHNATAVGIHYENFRVTGRLAVENNSAHVRRPARDLGGKIEMGQLANIGSIGLAYVDLHLAGTIGLKEKQFPVLRKLWIRIDHVGQTFRHDRSLRNSRQDCRQP